MFEALSRYRNAGIKFSQSDVDIAIHRFLE